MKKIFILLWALTVYVLAIGQNIGIGTTTPNASAQLEISSTNRGLLLPRMTEAEKNGIASPAQGLMVFNTTTNSFQFYNGVSWLNIAHSGIITGPNNAVPKFTGPWGLGGGMMVDNGAGISISNTSTPANASALLDMQSTNKGMLVPRMSSSQRLGISAPAKGLLVFDNNTNSFWYHNGTAWTELGAGGANTLWQELQDSIAYSTRSYVGINTDYNLIPPQANLQVNGSVLIQGNLNYSNANPAAGQIYTMNNTSPTQSIAPGDSVFRIYDPGGTGNYNNNMQGNILANSSSGGNGFKVTSTAANFGLGTGDTLWISKSSFPACRLNFEYRFVSTSTNPEDFLISTTNIYFIFRSNADGNNGSGFNFKVTRLYASAPQKELQAAGPLLYFNAATGGFAAGNNVKVKNAALLALGNNTIASGDNAMAIGVNATAGGISATALGSSTTASGDYAITIGRNTTASNDYAFALGINSNATGISSIAMGSSVTASGTYSIAMGSLANARNNNAVAIGSFVDASGTSSLATGYNTNATGDNSTSMGFSTTAAGTNSTALGNNTTAVGNEAIAMGLNTTAAGSGTMAFGSYVSTAGNPGCLIIGDRSTTTVLNAVTDNSFRARFDGGYRFYTSAAATTAESCLLASGSNAWSTASDRALKENFEPVNGEGFLQKIASIPLTSWNYKSQHPATFRHYGPMAQDFFAAFGKDSYGIIGNDTTINAADFDGVNLIAIQALEKRTAAQQQSIQQLERENAALKVRLEKLEALLQKEQVLNK